MSKETKKNYPRSGLAKQEEEILGFWDRARIFEQSVERPAPRGDYVFYDGPPFGTGEPHYGHILSSVAKDVVPRYWTMKGYRVERRWGWDCHGLPIENIIEKQLNISGKKEIEKYGIARFNEACRSQVLTYADIWDKMVRRIARWVDFKNSYKTMDANFMESVWWGFKTMWEKDLVYQGRKVLLYCPRCETPISNFEVAMDNSYQEITEPSVYVKFKAKYHPNTTGRGAGAMILNEKNEVLLVKRNEKGRRVTWALPGGKIDKGESPEEAVRREVMEELGVEIESAKAFNAQPDIFEGRLYETIVFEVRVKGEPKNMIPEETEKIDWFPLDKLPEINYPSSRDAIERFKNKTNNFFVPADINRDLANVYILAWTTTPWTLPGNVALAVGSDITYTMVKIHDDFFVLAKDRLEVIEHAYEVVKEFQGRELAGLHYQPLFDVPSLKENGKDVYYIAEADFVTTEDGTGVVHTAVVYGEDDYNLGVKLDLPVVPALDEKGVFNDTVGQFSGIYFKDADKQIIKDLEKRGLLFKKEDHRHAYPFCWRCETQLFYNAIPAWFISIDKIRKDLLEQNEKINWYPGHLKEGRFKLGIEQAPDWNISRNRFFATPLPIWECGKCRAREVVGSIEELKKKTGEKEIGDIHSHRIDHLSWPCPECKEGKMKRIKEVFDCWVESGSMSFAQHHYPFENKAKFEDNFPAQYISEYISQTRAWFYVMHVISTALFGSNSFENVVATGVILNEKGEKMSKSKKNYPDPWKVINEFGSDALRFYLMSSSLMHGDHNLYFNERELRDITRKTVMLLNNIHRFYKMFAADYRPAGELEKPEHVLDQWIIARLRQLINEVSGYMDNYDLPRAARPIQAFIDDLSTWYVRRSRERFKSDDQAGKKQAVATLGRVLLELSKVMAPFMPFISETIWQSVAGYGFKEKGRSVHLEEWPAAGLKQQTADDSRIIEEMEKVRKVVELGLNKRDEAGIKVRQPLREFTVFDLELSNQELLELIKDELNVKEVKTKKGSGEPSVELDTEISDDLKAEGLKRELVRTINAMRKQAGLTIEDTISVRIKCSKGLITVIKRYNGELKKETIAGSVETVEDGNGLNQGKEHKLNNETAVIEIKKTA